MPAAIFLGSWQFDRSDQRTERNQELIDQLRAEPVVLASSRDVSLLSEWAPVRIVGRFEQGSDILVRRRIQDGFNGFYVLSPFVPLDGGQAFLVNRGWLLAKGAAREEIDVPPAPLGQFELAARWRQAETPTGEIPPDLPIGQVLVINPDQIASRYPDVGPVNPSGYLQADDALATDEGSLKVVALPPLSQGPHLAYAVQWLIFGVAAIVGWVILAKREIRPR